MRIQRLPLVVANQIAAGEVIERPASVVKELLENALDARADSIHIDIGHGGLTQIKMSDNGLGILADDLPLAIEAQATSKISQLSDLYSIATLGFRGEALSSIASIARLAISSKPIEQEHAMMLLSEAGETMSLSPCARNPGTTIDVRDIFFNAPVRKKFLKSAPSEFQAIELVVKRFALSAPAIAIHLNHNDKQQLHLMAAHCDKTRLARVRKLLGKAFIDHAIYLEVDHAGLRLYGWISDKDYQRSQNDKLWVYVNGRMIRDKLLNHAIRQAYEDLLYPGRYPACLLYLTLNPSEVDVNVHPTKHEVRFQQPRLVHDFICSQLRKALQPPQPNPVYKIEPAQHLAVHESYAKPALLAQGRSAVLREQNWFVLNDSFALLFLEEQPYLVDILGMQKNWLFAVLKAQQLPLASRPLLVPISYPLKLSQPKAFYAYSQALGQLGIELDLASEHSFLVRSLPQAVPHLDLKQFLSLLFASSLPSINRLLELLTDCQSFNVLQLQQEEREVLIDYIRAQADDTLNRYCKHLSLEICRDLLNA